MSGNQQSQWPIERLLGGLSQLESALSADCAAVLAAVRSDLQAAIAERDGGRHQAAAVQLAQAMTRLAELADRLGNAEGSMMRALTGALIAGLAAKDRGAVESALERIQRQAGRPRGEPS